MRIFVPFVCPLWGISLRECPKIGHGNSPFVHQSLSFPNFNICNRAMALNKKIKDITFFCNITLYSLVICSPLSEESVANIFRVVEATLCFND